MPSRYKRYCDHCGEYYEGYGESYCSLDCVGASKAGRAPTDKGPKLAETGDTATAVSEGPRIRTLGQLLDAAEVDLDLWDVERHVVNKWEVGAKGPDGNVVVRPLFQVKAWLRKKWEATDLPCPIVLDIRRPAKRPPRAGVLTSVHYGDIHFPHHDPRALAILYAVLEETEPDIVVDHGDTLDCEEISRYPKDPYDRTSVKAEIQMAAEHFGRVTALTPHARHIWLEGNHEERKKRLIWRMAEDRRAGELLQLDGVREALEWGQLLGLDGAGWEIVDYPRHELLFDKLILKHGSTVRKHSAYSAKSEYDKYGKSGMSGHTHRIGRYSHTDYNGSKAWWEIGMLGRIREDYVDHANWQQGFAVVTWSEDRRTFGVEQVSIVDGRAYFRGKLYDGRDALQAAA